MTSDLYFFFYKSFILFIFIFCTYHELKNRKIKDYNWRTLYLIGFAIFLYETSISKHLLMFIFLKLTILLMVFIFSFYFFLVKIFGGSDGKFVFLIFLIYPIHGIKFTDILLIFTIIMILLFTLIMMDFLFNKKRKYAHLMIMFESRHLRKECRLFGFNLINLLDIYKYYKKGAVLITNYVIYNNFNNKLQLLIQKRPPMIIIIILSISVFLILK